MKISCYLYMFVTIFFLGCVTSINFLVVEQAKLLEKNKGYDISLKTAGVPGDIVFKDTVFLKRANGTYCSGVTFYVAMKVLEKSNSLTAFTLSDIQKFQKSWYGVYDNFAEKQCVDALTSTGLGIEITKMHDIRRGDFVQFWRVNGSGHSVIFLNFVFDDEGSIVGIKYISSQKSTDGIAVKEELFAAGNNQGINKQRFYAGRIKV